MVIVEPGSLNSQSQPQGLLDQFEALWLRGEIPDLAFYLNPTSAFDVGVWHDLIELDLEYRWKRFHGDVTKAERDQYGFPQFPQIEDYITLLEESQRHLVLTAELLAEEYRVRRTWGDRPDKKDYLERLPLDSVAVESALNQIDTEFEIERATPVAQDESSRIADEPTLLVNTPMIIEPDPVEGSETPLTLGKYQLESLLGRGGFGEVWKAYDPDLKRNVALKLPRSDRHYTKQMLETFRIEAQRMATLDRVPGILPVFEAGEIDGRVYIVSYLVQGDDLGRISQRQELPYEESARIVAKVAETLHRAHLKNLFHRDVKLSNILVSDEKEIYLSDFGLCVSEQEQLKEGYSTTGTVAYMSPEQIRGESHRLDGRADIYALGVVLYRLLTGRLPFVADTYEEYRDQVLYREPRPLRSIKDDIPPELERICLNCLRKDVRERYLTAGDLAGELRKSVRTLAETSSRSWWRPIFAAGVLLLVGLLMSQFFGRKDSPLEDVPPVAESNLLLHDITELAFQHGKGVNSWHKEAKSNSLLVQTRHWAMLSCGSVTLEGIKQLNLTGACADEDYWIGLFWGLDSLDDDNQKNLRSCLALLLSRGHRNGIPEKLELREFTVNCREFGEYQWVDQEIIWSQPLSESPIEQIQLALSLDEGELKSISYNGRRIELTELLKPIQYRHSQGDVGLWIFYGNLRFDSLEISSPRE